jgi:hypothetical protein
MEPSSLGGYRNSKKPVAYMFIVGLHSSGLQDGMFLQNAGNRLPCHTPENEIYLKIVHFIQTLASEFSKYVALSKCIVGLVMMQIC